MPPDTPPAASPARHSCWNPLSWRGAWGEPSNMLVPPLGGGRGERCVKRCRPQAGFDGDRSLCAVSCVAGGAQRKGKLKMDETYHDGMRALQDRFDSRRLADRLDERLARTSFTAEDRAFIESR